MRPLRVWAQLSQATRERGILLLLGLAFSVLSLSLPVFGAVLALFQAAPAVALFVRHGLLWAVLGLLLTTVPKAAVLSWGLCAESIALSFPPALFLGWAMRRQMQAQRAIIGGLLVATVCAGLFAAMFFIFAGEFPFAVILKTASEPYAPLSEAPFSNAQDFGDLLLTIVPTLLIVEAALSSFCSYLGAKRILEYWQVHTQDLPEFSTLHFPVGLLYLFGFSLVGLYWGTTRDIHWLYAISLNGELLATLAGVLEGLSLLSYVAKQFGAGMRLRAFILVAVILSGILLQFVAFTGLFDMYFDYRRRFQNWRHRG